MISEIKSFIMKARDFAQREYHRERLHTYNKKQAFAALEMLEKQGGKLDSKLKKAADEYALEVLGDRKYSPWIYVYTAIKHSFIEGWFPEYYSDLVVRPLTDGKYGNLAIIKTLTNRILQTRAIPDTAYLIDGIVFSHDFKPIGLRNALDVIFKDSEIVFFKLNDSASGKGVKKIERDTFKMSDFLNKHDGCFQSIIVPHVFFDEINKSSTATIRLTTVRNNIGEVSARAAYLRVSRDNEKYVTSDSGVRIPIDIDSGLLGEFGFMNDWSYSAKHPDSGFIYSGKQIPYFSDAKQLCISLHESFPHFMLIGWDFCIDKNNEVKIMEWNANGAGILFHEAFTGPCFTGLGWETLWRKDNKYLHTQT